MQTDGIDIDSTNNLGLFVFLYQIVFTRASICMRSKFYCACESFNFTEFQPFVNCIILSFFNEIKPFHIMKITHDHLSFIVRLQNLSARGK